MTDNLAQMPVSRALLLLAAVVVILAGMRAASPLLGPLLLALFLALLCEPFYDALRRRRVPAPAALALVALLLLGVVTGLTLIVAASAAQLVGNAGHYRQLLVQQFAQLRTTLEGAGFDLRGVTLPELLTPARLLDPVLALVTRIGDLAGTVLYTILAALFFLVDGPKLMARLRGQLGESHSLLAHLRTFQRDAVHYFRVRTYGNALTGLGVGIAFFLMGIDLAALWAVLTFLLSYIPYLGPLLAGIPPVLLAFAARGPAYAVLVVASILLINSVVENLLVPRLLSKSFSLPISVVFISLFFWTWVLGPPGVLLAVVLTQLVILLLDSFAESRWIAQLLSTPSRPAKPRERGS